MSLKPPRELFRDYRDLIRWCREQATWDRISKPEGTLRNTTTTNAADPHLAFPVKANLTYVMRLFAWFDTPAAADFTFTFSGPASPTLLRITGWGLGAGDLNPTNFNDQAYSVNHTSTGASTVGGAVQARILLQNGANDGVFSFDWAQNTSNGSDTEVLEGSFLEYYMQ